jgi:hypothetical protein
MFILGTCDLVHVMYEIIGVECTQALAALLLQPRASGMSSLQDTQLTSPTRMVVPSSKTPSSVLIPRWASSSAVRPGAPHGAAMQKEETNDCLTPWLTSDPYRL